MYSFKLIEIKKAEDFTKASKLANEIWRQHYSAILKAEQIDYMLDKFQSPEAIKDYVNTGYSYYFVAEGENTIGYTAIKVNKGVDLFISKIYIKKEHRGKGAGRFIIESIYNIAVQNNCKNMWLTVNKYNDGSLAAYEKLGFVKDGSQVTDIGGGFVMDDFVMKCEIEN